MTQPTSQTKPSCGFVFGVSGADYARLAERAAQTLRDVTPNAQIDLFTDADVQPGVFDQVHPLDKSWFRPKFEAMRRSRFDRTVYLDADIFVVADISDIFEVLDKFDIAAVHNQRRNSPWARTMWNRDMPNAFPQINGGLVGLKNTPEVIALIERVEQALIDENLSKDQPVFREAIFDSDLRLAILPPEYNFMEYRQAEMLSHVHTAPRVIHHFKLHRHIDKGRAAIGSLNKLMGPQLAAHVRRLLDADRTLNPSATRKMLPMVDRGLLGGLRLIWLQLCKTVANLFLR